MHVPDYNTSAAEIRKFVGILLLSGYNCLPKNEITGALLIWAAISWLRLGYVKEPISTAQKKFCRCQRPSKLRCQCLKWKTKVRKLRTILVTMMMNRKKSSTSLTVCVLLQSQMMSTAYLLTSAAVTTRWIFFLVWQPQCPGGQAIQESVRSGHG